MDLSNQTISNNFADDLLGWYDRHARVMAWRVAPLDSKKDIRIDPYLTWLSEVMLQQTQVATVGEYFKKFTTKWPTIHDLESAETDDVMKAWAGLGYYSRARNLKKCAEEIVANHGGEFPQSLEALKKLPGIGDYTASAISAIAFGRSVPVVDGNVERVISRIYKMRDPMPEGKGKVREKTAMLLSKARPGDFAQAMMDLGATLCTPKKPACSLCPVNAHCAAFASGEMENFPIKTPKKAKPTRKGAAFVIQNDEGAIYLQKRKESGLLGGMSEVPTTDWNSNQDGAIGADAAPFKAAWEKRNNIRHTFTHFHLELEVWFANASDYDGDGWWSSELAHEALPTVMRKVLTQALNQKV